MTQGDHSEDQLLLASYHWHLRKPTAVQDTFRDLSDMVRLSFTYIQLGRLHGENIREIGERKAEMKHRAADLGLQ